MKCAPDTYFAVPCHFDRALLDTILSISRSANAHRKVTEIYGCLSHSVVGHGRFPASVSQVRSLNSIRSFRDFAVSKGIRFIYLLNAPFKQSETDSDVVREHILNVLTVVQPHAVVVSSTNIMRIIREQDPNVAIYVSTIAGVKSPADLEPLLKFGPTRITPHHDMGRDFAGLEKLKGYTDQHDIELQLLLNESCLYGCRRRTQHYLKLSFGENDDEFQHHCNIVKYTKPVEIFASGWIRPEDVSWLASRFGIRHYKLSGRAKPKSWLPEVVQAYINGFYSGNLIRLFAITPPWSTRPWEELYLSNQQLQGFLQSLPAESDEHRYAYYSDWVNRLWNSGQLAVRCQPPQGVGYADSAPETQEIGVEI